MVRGKQWCYDSGLRIPLIIRWPQSFPAMEGLTAGRVNDQLISTIDLTATALAIAGVAKPASMQGRTFLGPDAEPPRTYVFGARDRSDETTFRIRTVRDKRYRYIRNFMPQRPFLQLNRYKEAQYPVIRLMRKLHAEGKLTPPQAVLMAPQRPAEELYDLTNDPYEIRNLANSPQHQGVLKRMRAALNEWLQDTDDQGRFPEDPAVIEYYERLMREHYDDQLKQANEPLKRQPSQSRPGE
jgi:arylsulfatase A-like enzyme